MKNEKQNKRNNNNFLKKKLTREKFDTGRGVKNWRMEGFCGVTSLRHSLEPSEDTKLFSVPRNRESPYNTTHCRLALGAHHVLFLGKEGRLSWLCNVRAESGLQQGTDFHKAGFWLTGRCPWNKPDRLLEELDRQKCNSLQNRGSVWGLKTKYLESIFFCKSEIWSVLIRFLLSW